MPPGRRSAFRAGIWPDRHRESTEIGRPAGRRADFGAVPVAVRPKSGPEGRFTVRKRYCVTHSNLRTPPTSKSDACSIEPVRPRNVRNWYTRAFRYTLCYAIVRPGRKSAFRAGCWPDRHRESTEIGRAAGRRADFGAVPMAVRPKSSPEDRFTVRKRYCVTHSNLRTPPTS